MGEGTGNASGVDLLQTVVQESLGRNQHVLGRQVAGLTHADSLLQPQPRGNCLNWVVGHMAASREKMLSVIGEETVFGPDALAHYVRGSEPILADGDGVLPLADLLSGFDAQQDRLARAIAAASPEALAQPSPGMEGMSVIEELQFHAWHETYHLGQTDLLRQLSGVDDCVIA
ncbi:MAG: DinB family protein [Thermomicrobiales bacterium]